jgi:TonB family protein
MRKIFIFCLGLFGFTNLYAQTSQPAEDTNRVYSNLDVRVKPIFSGGSVMKYINDAVVYPKQAMDSNIQGVVYISFIVEKNGTVTNVKVYRGIKRIIDSEALRVVSLMPKWSPGSLNGKPVRVENTLPVRFDIKPIDNDTIYLKNLLLQKKPVFSGDVNKFLSDSLRYPKEAIKKKIEGEVDLRFIVKKDGSVSNIKILHGIKQGDMLNKEAERLVSIMPKWVPAFYNFQPVPWEDTVKVIFDLKNYFRSKKSLATIQPIDEDTLYKSVQVKPQFPGDLNQWLSTYIQYPQDAKNSNIQGTVYITFIIEKDGDVSTVKMLQGVWPTLDKEALRVVSAMPKWSPGIQDNKAVRVQYMVPIHFILRD